MTAREGRRERGGLSNLIQMLQCVPVRPRPPATPRRRRRPHLPPRGGGGEREREGGEEGRSQHWWVGCPPGRVFCESDEVVGVPAEGRSACLGIGRGRRASRRDAARLPVNVTQCIKISTCKNTRSAAVWRVGWLYRGGVGIIPSSKKTSCSSEGVLPDEVFTHLKLQVLIFFRRENLNVQAPPPPQS